VRTCANETAGTFSVSYLASLRALARIVTATFPDDAGQLAAALPALPATLSATLDLTPAPACMSAFAEYAPILISGFGADLVTAQETALKVKEGAWLWTDAMSPEFALHGTPASFHAGMSAIVLLPEGDDGGRSRLLVDVLAALA
jgi:glucosamine--fructose-6-phosphate aminotransferase (isomerizing)